MKAIILTLGVIAVCSCEGNAKMKNMSNADLSNKHDTCIRKNPSSPGRATACENIRKECERRSKEGNYAC